MGRSISFDTSFCLKSRTIPLRTGRDEVKLQARVTKKIFEEKGSYQSNANEKQCFFFAFGDNHLLDHVFGRLLQIGETPAFGCCNDGFAYIFGEKYL